MRILSTPVTKIEGRGVLEYDEKREANDHVALREAGKRRYKDGDYKSAFEYLSKAAELGDVEAHYHLSFMYRAWEGEKDEKKKLHHLEVAAIGGHPDARFDIGFIEYENGKPERSVKHWTIAAKLGHDHSLQSLSECYKGGLVSTEDFAAALRGHQAAVDATKNTQREAAE